jgi:hypothetical protein
MHKFDDCVSQDLLGGPRPWALAWVVDFQNAGTFFLVESLIGIADFVPH